MKIKLKTKTLQEMVAKSLKGASCNKLIPITSLMELKVVDGTLTLTTTNGANYLKVFEKGVSDVNFCIVVEVGVFSKLVAKTTCETITLELEESTLNFEGNGKYKLELPLDENGKLINFPTYQFEKVAEPYETKLSTINTLLTLNKPSLATTMEVPVLTAYYLSEKVYTSDTYLVCVTELDFLNKGHEPLLIHGDLMDLLGVMSDESIKVYKDNEKLLFESSNTVIYGTQLSGIEDFPIEGIDSYLEAQFSSSCVLPKTALMNVLDRLSLFVTSYDKNGIYLTFTKEGVLVSSKKSTGSELILYQNSSNYMDYKVYIDIEMLKTQISVQPEETVNLHYGSESAIKLTSGKTVQVIALLEDESLEENG